MSIHPFRNVTYTTSGLGWIFLGKQHKLKKTDMRFGMWNARSLYRIGSLMTVVKKV
jgi:hypothetical protein